VSSAVEKIADVLLNEGGAPGSSIHSWRCEHPDRYGPCRCVTEVAGEIVTAIRAMSAEDQAEVFGGHAESVMHHAGVFSPFSVQERAVGPWRPSDGLNPAGTSTDPTTPERGWHERDCASWGFADCTCQEPS
jgi:hypothetical protein